MRKTIKYFLIGLVSALLFLFLTGIPTVLIPNPWFVRMIPATAFDYVFLIISSVLIGAYFTIHYYKKNTNKNCARTTTAGGIGSFLAFGCPICNKLLVLLFGTSALLQYFEPYRVELGLVSTALLLGAIIWRLRN